MELLYPFFIAFTLIFFSELGDKTQLLVLSFSSKNKAKNILLGVAIGTFLSHGFAILFGSNVAYFSGENFQFYLKLFTYFSFLLFGLIGFLPKKNKNHTTSSNKSTFLQKFCNLKLNCIVLIAICILVGELGDKTFLASLSLGIQYPDFKISLILGAILGMIASNSVAIFCGKLIGNRLKPAIMELVSNILFIIFGLIGLISFCIINTKT